MKRLFKFLKWLGILFVLLLVMFVGVNLFDETPDPSATAVLFAQPKLRPEDNAYFYLAGLYSEASRNPSEAGEACVLAQLKIAHATGLISAANKIPECENNNVLRIQSDAAIYCDWRKTSCLHEFAKKRSLISALAAKNHLVLERHEKLIKFKNFEDAFYLHPYTIFPTSPPVPLYQAISTSLFDAGDTAAFIRRMTDETAFYRTILRGETSLLYKVIAASWLERSARLVSEAIRVRPVLAYQDRSALLDITRPLSLSERSFQKTMEAESRFSASILQTVPAENSNFFERWFFQLLFKPNATNNYLYRSNKILGDISQLPTEDYLAAELAAEKWIDSGVLGFLKLAYNPIGKTLVGISVSEYTGYPRRVIDIDGLLRLVSLQIQIAAMKIPDAEIPAFLARSDRQFRDPYSGKAMRWDKIRGLFFQGHGNRTADKEGFISVKI